MIRVCELIMCLQIVPTEVELIVETRVSTTDVGHVHKCQSADVKINSYDSSRFGTLDGTVQRVSATTFLDERQTLYYLAEIRLATNYVGDDPEYLKIIPGMTVTVDIKTGEKSSLAYLVKPISRGFSRSFRER